MRRIIPIMMLSVILVMVTGSQINAQGGPITSSGLTLNGFNIAYRGRAYNTAQDQTTFTYTVSGTNAPPDLSQFDLGIPTCDPALETASYSPSEGVSIGADLATGVSGIKWDLPLHVDQTRTYAITFNGDVAEGSIDVAVKGGDSFEAGQIAGAACTRTSIDITKSVSVDGGATWNDAEIPTGPIVDPGAPVSFLLQIVNDGDFPLTNITLTDSEYDASLCLLPAGLDVGASVECILGPFNATEGQHTNVATVTAKNGGKEATDSDAANYFAGTLALIHIEKFVALADGGTWFDADTAPGLIVPEDDRVSFRIVVTNDGSEAFSNITLTDSKYTIGGCDIPATLAPEGSFECVLGPFDVEGDEAQVNTATVTAVANGESYTATDEAHYQRAENNDDVVIIIIEGPVQIIIDNIIIIYGIQIELDPNDPLLKVIHVGDIVRVEGNTTGDGTVIIIIAVVVIIIDVDIFIVDGNVWRDDGDCGNPPPPWAPAHGWRRKCADNIIIIIGGKGKGMGMGDDD